jgi:hypothetical protein
MHVAISLVAFYVPKFCVQIRINQDLSPIDARTVLCSDGFFDSVGVGASKRFFHIGKKTLRDADPKYTIDRYLKMNEEFLSYGFLDKSPLRDAMDYEDYGLTTRIWQNKHMIALHEIKTTDPNFALKSKVSLEVADSRPDLVVSVSQPFLAHLGVGCSDAGVIYDIYSPNIGKMPSFASEYMKSPNGVLAELKLDETEYGDVGIEFLEYLRFDKQKEEAKKSFEEEHGL